MKFKKWCVEHNYTALKVSEITGISAKMIFKYWTGERTPSRKRERLLKDTLGIPSGLFDE